MPVAQPNLLIKRSMRINRHRTSVALEQVFWDAVELMARQQRKSLPVLIGAIDAQRQLEGGQQSLASALRCAVIAPKQLSV